MDWAGGVAFDALDPASVTEDAETWEKAGAHARYQEIPGTNHFTVLDALSDPDSEMVRRIVELTGKAAVTQSVGAGL